MFFLVLHSFLNVIQFAFATCRVKFMSRLPIIGPINLLQPHYKTLLPVNHVE